MILVIVARVTLLSNQQAKQNWNGTSYDAKDSMYVNLNKGCILSLGRLQGSHFSDPLQPPTMPRFSKNQCGWTMLNCQNIGRTELLCHVVPLGITSYQPTKPTIATGSNRNGTKWRTLGLASNLGQIAGLVIIGIIPSAKWMERVGKKAARRWYHVIPFSLLWSQTKIAI